MLVRRSMKLYYLVLIIFFAMQSIQAQSVQEDDLGAWYMYFYNAKFGDSNFGIQGDFQWRYWETSSDLEQRLLRSGFTYSPEGSSALFTFGYANIASGVPGDDNSINTENRIYQEALLPQRLFDRVLLTHRFRYEQRWVEGQDARTRFRYNLFMNVLLNSNLLSKGTFYIALYNETFINGERAIGGGREVELFDRNRTYLGLGYGLFEKARIQLGWMRQTTDNWAKNQLQFSVHHNW